MNCDLLVPLPLPEPVLNVLDMPCLIKLHKSDSDDDRIWPDSLIICFGLLTRSLAHPVLDYSMDQNKVKKWCCEMVFQYMGEHYIWSADMLVINTWQNPTPGSIGRLSYIPYTKASALHLFLFLLLIIQNNMMLLPFSPSCYWM